MSTCATCRYMLAGWCNAADRRRAADAPACELYRPKAMTLVEMSEAGALGGDEDLEVFFGHLDQLWLISRSGG